MKASVLLLSLFAVFTTNVWASNLMPYIEMQVERQNLITFSSQGIQFKACNACETTQLKPARHVAYYEHNNPIDLRQATEFFIKKEHSFTSIFYHRHTLVYDQVVFGGVLEVEPPLTHSHDQ